MERDDLFTIDFETTDKDPLTAHPVEIGLYSRKYGELINELIRPPISIPPETSAIHHISNKDVGDARDWADVSKTLTDWYDSRAQATGEVPILVAHNASYEQGILRNTLPNAPFICTYKCALRVWPDLPSYKNGAIRYHFGLTDIGRKHAQSAHSAMHDCKVTDEILDLILQDATIKQCLEWTKLPKALTKIPFGKHAGQPWKMIPGEYLNWIVRQKEMDFDVSYCAKQELERRKNPNATPGSN